MAMMTVRTSDGGSLLTMSSHLLIMEMNRHLRRKGMLDCIGLHLRSSSRQHNVSKNLRGLLSRINQYISFRGISIKLCYKQFDPVNTGCVTESQFYRCFPGPADITESEIVALANRYRSATKYGLVDYIAFALEVAQVAEEDEHNRHPNDTLCTTRDEPAEIKKRSVNECLDSLINAIRFEAFRHGIRVSDFFKDYDKLSHDSISPQQFKAALTLSMDKVYRFTKDELAGLTNLYSTGVNTVRWKQFCQRVDWPFLANNLEKGPNMSGKPHREHDNNRLLNVSSNADREQRVNSLLKRISDRVDEMRIPTYEFFKDFDHGSAKSGLLTPNQMSRVIASHLQVPLTKEDVKILSERFTDSKTGLVNYRNLSKAIDSQLYFDTSLLQPKNSSLDDDESFGRPAEFHRDVKPANPHDTLSALSTWSDDNRVEDLVARIRHLVLTQRINLKPWFEDFDKLHSGKMSKDHFVRCLTRTGLNRLQINELSPKAIDSLCARYQLPNNANTIQWTAFIDEIDEVFTTKNLEKTPMKVIAEQNTYVQPCPGASNWSQATSEMVRHYNEGMRNVRRQMMERRMNVKPEFEAFDKHGHRHCSVDQIYQLFTMVNFHLEREQQDAIVTRYADDMGFNWGAFLEDLDPVNPEDRKWMYPVLRQEMNTTNSKNKLVNEIPPLKGDATGIMDDFKSQIFRRQLRVSDVLRDHDKLNHGDLPRETFRRALGQLPIKISDTELSVVEDHYMSAKRPGFINWRRFCFDLEEAFTTHHLEKDPQRDVMPFKPQNPMLEANLSPGAGIEANRALRAIAEQVRERNIHLDPLFKDFDVTNQRAVSKNQFRRVLISIGVGDSVTERQWNALYEMFRHPLGLSTDVNYSAFIDEIHTIAGIPLHAP